MVDLGKVSGSGGEDPPDWQNEIGAWAAGGFYTSGLVSAYKPMAPNSDGYSNDCPSNVGSPGGQEGAMANNKTFMIYRKTLTIVANSGTIYGRLYNETVATSICSISIVASGVRQYTSEAGDPLVIYNYTANHEVYAQVHGLGTATCADVLFEARILDR